MLREFVLGDNLTGFVADASTPAIGGEDPSLLQGPHNILPGREAILFGEGTATSEFIAPTATVEAWNSFFSGVIAGEEATETGSVS